MSGGYSLNVKEILSGRKSGCRGDFEWVETGRSISSFSENI
jgi:hypothetical protein